MEPSKIILYTSILIVLLLIIDIYRRSVRKRQMQKRSKSFNVSKESLNSENEDGLLENDDLNARQVDLPSLYEGLLIVHVMAPRGYNFYGDDLQEVFRDFGFSYSDEGYFQTHTQEGLVLLNIMNVIEPGVFPRDELNELTTPGITILMDLVEVQATNEELNIMLDTMNNIAECLGSTLLNENMLRFTEENYRQYAEYLGSVTGHNHMTSCNS